jgi:3-phosphoshikimate 1-carboxyvinyltransferase
MVEPERALGCGNSGTTMRLLMGLVAGAPIRTVLTGDASLSRRPMERVAAPLRELGASIQTLDGHAPVRIEGGSLHGADLTLAVPSAQVKSAVLLAGLVADGRTRVTEPVVTRDHTERALAALGAPIERSGPTIEVEPFQHRGFGGVLPGDPSSAAFLAVAAALTGSGIAVHGLGLNPTRLSFLAVLERMGVPSRTTIDHEVVGEPVGVLQIMAPGALRPTVIPGEELPCIIDEVPVLAMLATATGGETRFVGASELRVKESDRLAALVEGIRALGGEARADGDDLIVHGTGLAGGRAQARGDHRMAMAFAVGALGALASCEIEGMDAADVSFPGFIPALASLGAQIEVQG